MEIGLGKTRKKALGTGRLSSKGLCEEKPPWKMQKDLYVYFFIYPKPTVSTQIYRV